jgi:hypothetical protein
MRQLKMGIAMAATALMLAVVATSATAGEFIAPTDTSTRSSSGTAGEQRFQAGPFTITCAATTGRGMAETELLNDNVKFNHCQSSAQVGGETLDSKATVKGRVNFLYTASGHVALSRITIQVEAPRCEILLGQPEEVGGAGNGKASISGLATFTNVSDASHDLRLFPTGFQHKLSIETEAEAIDLAYQGACAGFAPSTEGSYSGTVTDEAVHGDLEGNGEGTGWNRVKNT